MAEPDPNPYAPPVAPDQPPPAVDNLLINAGDPAQLRVAGILLLVNAAVVLVERVLTIGQPGPSFGGIGPAVIDSLIAVSFLKGNDRYRTFAIVRVILGLLLFTGLNISQGDFVSIAASIVGYGGLLLVLVGKPQRTRLITGTVLFGLFVLLELVGLAVISSGRG